MTTIGEKKATDWFESRQELLAFARALDGCGAFDEDGIPDLLYFLERPWKWTPEYNAWVAAGRPAETLQDGPTWYEAGT